MLVGTTSVEKSEMISKMLTHKYGIKHEVLNAKYHEREAQIVLVAGQTHKNAHGNIVGNVTIATNMAGRGTDIKLAPDALFEVTSLGSGKYKLKRGGANSRSTPRTKKTNAPRRIRSVRTRKSPADCTSSAPSATPHGASTISCAAGPVGRAIQVLPASTFRCKTI